MMQELLKEFIKQLTDNHVSEVTVSLKFHPNQGDQSNQSDQSDQSDKESSGSSKPNIKGIKPPKPEPVIPAEMLQGDL